MNWKNQLTTLLGIDYPVVQAPMLGVTSPEMVAAIANAGGLGSLPVGGLSAEKTEELIIRIKQLTDKPFAVNLFVHENAATNPATALPMLEFLQKIAARYQIDYATPDLSTFRFYHYRDQIDVLTAQKIRIVTFTFGILADDIIQKLKSQNITLIGTATCVEEAVLLETKGMDVVTAQGIEAGGHRGTFLEHSSLPQIGSMSLIPQIADRVSIPVLAAGGICDGRSIKAAFALGASGVQIGTAFIASDESIAIPAYKEAVQTASDTSTALTKAVSGRWARGVKNTLMTEVGESGLEIPEYPVQIGLTTPARNFALAHNNREFTSLWAGQSAYGALAKPAAEIFRELIGQAERM